MRVGVFGSAFNPPHIGHSLLVDSALELLDLDRVILVPTAKPVHKKLDKFLSSEQRLMLAQLAFYQWTPDQVRDQLKFRKNQDAERFLSFYRACYELRADARIEVSDVEFRMEREGQACYMVETLKRLKREEDIEPVLLIGADQAVVFDIWKDFEILLDKYEIVVASRSGKDQSKISQKFPKMKFLDWRGFEVSSSEIRRRIAEGFSVRYLVEPAVEWILKFAVEL